MDDTEDFEHSISQLDRKLFDGIKGISSNDDRRCWLALQRAVRDSKTRFVYLEVGSYVGGSIQQYLLDPRCSRIYSIDNRPAVTPDMNGEVRNYADNSLERMIENLRAVAPHELGKLVCFDTDARDVDPALIVDAPDLCFIDAEHTDSAAQSDFLFCLKVCAPDATIYFHNESRIRPGIGECLRYLKHSSRRCTAYKFAGSTFAIALDGSPVNADPRVAELASNGKAWITWMELTRKARRWVPRFLRPVLGRIRDRWILLRVSKSRSE